MSTNNILQTVNSIANHAKTNKIAHLSTQDLALEGNFITVNDTKTIHFGSCSYLGFEFLDEVKESAKHAIDCYGTQFSSSRAYLSQRHYEELEEKLSTIFGSPTVVAPTTTLGHIAAIPVLVCKDDVVILDHQVHNSVQTAAALVKAKGTKVELLRHNRIDLLEARIVELRHNHKKIWYMADGIYSMYGDTTPIDEIYNLLDKYPEFHFYVDDAHAMSCFGKNGRGFVLSKHDIHPRMVVTTSLNKAFASGGGALIFPTKELAQLVKNVGGPLITSGPMQPGALGAAIAVANIHLSDRITEYQEDLQQNIKYTDLILKKYGLPNLSDSFSPIFFIAVSLPKMAYNIINKMKEDGFFLNIGIFPAVPIKNTGVRFTITRLHTFKQIEDMVKALFKNFNLALTEENVTLDSIYKAFKISSPQSIEINNKVNSFINHTKLKVEHVNSICEINKISWNNTIGRHGTIDWDGLNVLENAFKGNKEAYQNWEFDYLIIRDSNDKIILSTFLTTSISKDDLLAEKEVSLEIEAKRKFDPYFMSSKTLMLGSQLTEGTHLYLDRESPFWKNALELLFDLISELQNSKEISTTMIRDLEINDAEMDELMMNNGFFKIQSPTNYKIQNITWNSHSEYYQALSKNSKRHYRKFVTRYSKEFNFEVIENPTEEQVQFYYELYKNIQERNLTLSTYQLPIKLFREMAKLNNWEIISLTSTNDSENESSEKIVAMAACYKGMNDYSAVIAGIDYESNRSQFSYRQLLAKVIERARGIEYTNIALGYTSGVEKKHFSASPIESVAYMQIKDNYKMESMEYMSTTKKRMNDAVNTRRVLPI